MDDRPDMSAVSRNGSPEPAVLIAHPANHAVALAVTERLRASGVAVVPVANVYEAAVELARQGERFAAVVLAVDFFNREELRFFSMAARRWPAVRTAAVTRPAFAYKASMADLAGAAAVCADPARAGDLASALGIAPQAGAGPAARTPRETAWPEPSPKVESLVTPRVTVPDEPAPGVQPPEADTSQAQDAGAQPEPGQPARERKPPAPPQRAATTLDILTQEEIEALMAEMDDEDLPPDGDDDE